MLRLNFILLLPFVTAFAPVWIGPEFRETSFVQPEENEHLQTICGRASTSHYPWAVSILLHGQNRLGGTIISPYHILTVAHGFMQFQSGAGAECVASLYRSIESLRRDRVVVYGGKCIRGHHPKLPNHPSCPVADVTPNKIRSVLVDGMFAAGSCETGHDFAIIELENKIEFNDRIGPACLPNTMWPALQNILTVVGWGRTVVFNESGPLMREAPMLVDKLCRRPWSDKLPKDADDLLCATSLNITDYYAPRICHGDSGAGMEQRDERGRATVIGMTSFGTKGCPANLLARFTRVGYFIREICTYTGVCSSAKH